MIVNILTFQFDIHQLFIIFGQVKRILIKSVDACSYFFAFDEDWNYIYVSTEHRFNFKIVVLTKWNLAKRSTLLIGYN